MSKKTCFTIFVAALVIILASYVLNFAPITREVDAVFAQMQNIYIALSAVIISLLMSKNKHYWLIMLGVSIIAAGIIQVVVQGEALMTIGLLYKALAFIVYVYLVALARFML
jgi:hypothetical protein